MTEAIASMLKSAYIRTVIYASCSPAKLATNETLEEKRLVFSVYGATTHWAHGKVYLRPLEARLPDGSLDPQNRDNPRDQPEMTDQLLKDWPESSHFSDQQD